MFQCGFWISLDFFYYHVIFHFFAHYYISFILITLTSAYFALLDQSSHFDAWSSGISGICEMTELY